MNCCQPRSNFVTPWIQVSDEWGTEEADLNFLKLKAEAKTSQMPKTLRYRDRQHCTFSSVLQRLPDILLWDGNEVCCDFISYIDYGSIQIIITSKLNVPLIRNQNQTVGSKSAWKRWEDWARETAALPLSACRSPSSRNLRLCEKAQTPEANGPTEHNDVTVFPNNRNCEDWRVHKGASLQLLSELPCDILLPM